MDREYVDLATEDFHQLFFSNGATTTRLNGIINEIAKADIPVLIKGESGTGKELLAYVIHRNSPRREKLFVKVDCGITSEAQLKREFFGFDRDPATGDYLSKPGKLALAHQGTILLHEAGNADLSVQKALLQILRDRQSFLLNENRKIPLDVRVVMTTKDNIGGKSALAADLHADLFDEMNVTINLLPLRKRQEQILPLANYFLNFYRARYQKATAEISQRTMDAFQSYSWPGNFRELGSTVKGIVLYGEEKVFAKERIRNLITSGTRPDPYEAISSISVTRGTDPIALKEIGKKAAEAVEKEIIQRTLQKTHWNRKEAAKLLCISYKALLHKIQRYRLDDTEGTV